MSKNTVEKYHKPYSELVLESKKNYDLFLREVRLHNLTIGRFHSKEVSYKKQIAKLEQKLISAEKGRRDLVVHYEQQVRNMQGCEELVMTLTKKLAVEKS